MRWPLLSIIKGTPAGIRKELPLMVSPELHWVMEMGPSTPTNSEAAPWVRGLNSGYSPIYNVRDFQRYNMDGAVME